MAYPSHACATPAKCMVGPTQPTHRRITFGTFKKNLADSVGSYYERGRQVVRLIKVCVLEIMEGRA